MANQFYNPTGNPPTNGPGASASVRAEFAAIAAAFDKLPATAGNPGRIVVVDPSGSALTFASTISESGTTVTFSGMVSFTGASVSLPANTTLNSLPIATTTGTQTLTNKTLTNPALTNPTISGGATLSGTFAGGTFASPTLTGPTIAAATFTGAVSFAASPTVPSPANATDAANKGYVDTAVGAIPPPTSKIQSITAVSNSGALAITLAPTTLDLRSATLSSGAINTRAVSSPLSLTLPSNATLGVGSIPGRVVVLALDNAGVIELAVCNLAGGTPLDETTLISTTSLSGTATSATVIYSATARSNVPFRVVGFFDTQYVLSAWVAPTLVQGIGGQALASLSSLGYGQTYQNVTAQRALGTTYTNNTGKPIEVRVQLTATAATTASITVGGVTLLGSNLGGGGAQGAVTAIVGPGQSYSSSPASANLTTWFELR